MRWEKIEFGGHNRLQIRQATTVVRIPFGIAQNEHSFRRLPSSKHISLFWFSIPFYSRSCDSKCILWLVFHPSDRRFSLLLLSLCLSNDIHDVKYALEYNLNGELERQKKDERGRQREHILKIWLSWSVNLRTIKYFAFFRFFCFYDDDVRATKSDCVHAPWIQRQCQWMRCSQRNDRSHKFLP